MVVTAPPREIAGALGRACSVQHRQRKANREEAAPQSESGEGTPKADGIAASETRLEQAANYASG
jgi:hypothetical protein